MPGTVLSTLQILTQVITTMRYELLSFFFTDKETENREVRKCVHGHKASKCQSQDSNPGFLALEPILLPITL